MLADVRTLVEVEVQWPIKRPRWRPRPTGGDRHPERLQALHNAPRGSFGAEV